MNVRKILVAGTFLVFTGIFFYFDLSQYLSLDFLKEKKEFLLQFYQHNHTLSLLLYFGLYILVTALSLPGAAVLTLAGGAIFGFTKALVMVSFASSIGASLAFLVARYLLRDSIEKRYKSSWQKINAGIEQDGAFYLFSLRLIPLVPFFVINLLMGLTKMSLWKFYWVSQLGMLAGTAVYVNAGKELAHIDSLVGIASPRLLFAFILLGIFPLLAKKGIGLWQQRQIYKAYRKPKQFDYNLIAIGAGAGGLVTSYIAAAVRAKVALIEEHKMGGDCLNTGCVPSKALIRSAKVLNLAKQAEKFALQGQSLSFDFAELMQRVQKIIAKIEPNDSVERYTSLGVDCYAGRAKVLSPWEVELDGKILSCQKLVIATGASPWVPDIEGIDQLGERLLVSENLWQLRELPKRLVVLGAGAIGCELAQCFARLGSQVHLIDRGEQVLGKEDRDVGDWVGEKFRKEGIQLHLGHEILGFTQTEGSRQVKIRNSTKDSTIEFDYCLCALGRRANSKGFGLEELGIQTNSLGQIVTNDRLQTNYPNIYAVGDVAGPYQFTHTAAHMAWYASVNALFFNRFAVDYRVIPWATFVDPEVARVGLSEREAQEQAIAYDLYRYDLEDLDRAITDSTNEGFVKVLTKKGSDEILGVVIVGSHASDTIAEFVLAMKYRLGLNKILSTIHLYPSMAEANKYVAGAWKKATKPESLLRLIEKWHRWRRS